MPRRTARVAAAVPPAPPDRKSQTPAAAGRRSLRGTAGVAAGGSGGTGEGVVEKEHVSGDGGQAGEQFRIAMQMEHLHFLEAEHTTTTRK